MPKTEKKLLSKSIFSPEYWLQRSGYEQMQQFGPSGSLYYSQAHIQLEVARKHFLPHLINPHLLDVGAGTGNFTTKALLAEQNLKITSTDLSHTALLIHAYKTGQLPEAAFTALLSGLSEDSQPTSELLNTLEETRQYHAQKNSAERNATTVANMEQLPFRYHSFDGVHAVQAVHWADLQKTLHEVHRVVKPGGYFIFCTSSSFYNWEGVPLFNNSQETIDSYNYMRHPFNAALIAELNPILERSNLPTISEDLVGNLSPLGGRLTHETASRSIEEAGFIPVQIPRTSFEPIVEMVTPNYPFARYYKVVCGDEHGVTPNAVTWKVPAEMWYNVFVNGAVMQHFASHPALSELNIQVKTALTEQAFNQVMSKYPPESWDVLPLDANTMFFLQAQ
jgi:ubiquinone/menaquinone biosynthesis C-methylase UbiE